MTEIGKGADERAHTLKRRFFIALPLGIVVMALSMVPAWQFPGWQWVVAVAALPVVTYCAWPFHQAALRAARHASTTMDTLVSLGVVVASIWSYCALFFGNAGHIGMEMSMSLIPRSIHSDHPTIYFEAATMIVVFLLAGRWAEARTRYRAGDALRELLTLGVKQATLLEGPARRERTVPAQDLQVGDLVLVRAGEKIPTDGIVVEGQSAVDNSLLTGESIPVDVGVDHEVTGGAVNTWGSLVVRATRVGEETALAQIGRMVTDAQATKAPIQRLADTVSSYFVPAIIALSVVTFGVWMLTGHSWITALTCAVAVLVVACPCALGLATPTALLVGSGRAAQLGIVIRNAEVLEHTRKIDTVVLDKTGTVTSGKMRVAEVIANRDEGAAAKDGEADGSAGVTEDQVAALACSAESGSEHPLAKAIRQYAQGAGLAVPAASGFTNHPGGGVSAIAGDQLLLLGNPEWMSSHDIALPEWLTQKVAAAQQTGATVSVLASAAIPANRTNDGEGGDNGGFADVAGAAPQFQVPNSGQIRIEMRVEGMTCAACVRRVEKKLGKLEGVSPSVNLATETATMVLDRDYSDEELEKIVNDAGYHGDVVRRAVTPMPASDLDSVPDAIVDAGFPASSPAATQGSTPGQSGAAKQTGPEAGNPGARDLANLTDVRVLGAIALSDEVKAGGAAAVSEMRVMGIDPVLLTGDNQAAADHVAKQIGIDTVIAQVLPDQKRNQISRLQDEGRQVAMVGDGVNDAAALAQASNQGLGIAMGSGTDLAIAVADITLMRADLAAVPQAIRISRRTLHTIKGNLFWAFFYNVLMVPLAAAGMVNPMLASAAMACSSVFVVLNSLRLRKCQ